MIVEDIYGRADTLVQVVDVIPEVTYFLPNAFSPNGDGVNDVYHAKGFVDGMLSFKLNILDRWGSVIFSTTDPNFEWYGTHMQNGQLVPKSVYVYQMSYTTSRGETIQDQGYVRVVK